MNQNHNEKGHIGEDAAFKKLSAGNANKPKDTRPSRAFKPASLWVDSIDNDAMLSAWKNLLNIIKVTITSKGEWK